MSAAPLHRAPEPAAVHPTLPPAATASAELAVCGICEGGAPKSYPEDAPAWVPLSDVLEELGMTCDELMRAYPHVNLSHTGLEGQVIVDRRDFDV
jgi:hypothetical protein